MSVSAVLCKTYTTIMQKHFKILHRQESLGGRRRARPGAPAAQPGRLFFIKWMDGHMVVSTCISDFFFAKLCDF